MSLAQTGHTGGQSGRLLGVVAHSPAYPSGTTSYAYDGVGNRTSMTTPGGTTSYTYDAADHLTQAGSTTYSYDANGNLTGRGADTLTWDSADRLTGATVSGTTASMSYDGTDNLVSKTVGGSTTRYVYDRNLPLPQLLTAGDTNYQSGPGMAAGFGPMMQEAAGTKSWLHGDALGSVRFTTNSSGASVGSSTYDAFGTQRATSGQQDLFRFAGQEQHADIGLIHMRARWNDPAIGRFISRDPVRGSAAAPQSLNSYAYARNNPCNLRDPSGRTPVGGGGGGKGAGAGVSAGVRVALDGGAWAHWTFNSAGGSTCFAGEGYKPIWYWKDAPEFDDPGGDLQTRMAAYWAWVDAVYAWSDEILAEWAKDPRYTKVAEVQGCRSGGAGVTFSASSAEDESDEGIQLLNPWELESCQKLWTDIGEARRLLREKAHFLREDPFSLQHGHIDLDQPLILPGGRNVGSVRGHQIQFLERQVHLRRLVDRRNSECRGPGSPGLWSDIGELQTMLPPWPLYHPPPAWISWDPEGIPLWVWALLVGVDIAILINVMDWETSVFLPSGP